MDKVGLILEGGGMRGIYTAGVLDFFIDKNIEVDLVVGVSAGGCHAASYLSKQYKCPVVSCFKIKLECPAPPSVQST